MYEVPSPEFKLYSFIEMPICFHKVQDVAAKVTGQKLPSAPQSSFDNS